MKEIHISTLVDKFFSVNDLKIDDENLVSHLEKVTEENKITIPYLVGGVISGIKRVHAWRKKLTDMVFHSDKLRLFDIAEHVFEGAKVVNARIHNLQGLREKIKVGENCRKYTVISPKEEGRIVNVHGQ